MSAGDDGPNPGAPNSRHACASCKHQRKRCDNECPMAPFFPANRADAFREVHAIFGVKNMSRMLKPGPENQRRSHQDCEKIVESLEWEARAWKIDPIQGPLGAYRKLERELELLKNQILINNFNFNNNNNNYNAQPPPLPQLQQNNNNNNIMPHYQAPKSTVTVPTTMLNRNPVPVPVPVSILAPTNNNDFGYNYSGPSFGGLDHHHHHHHHHVGGMSSYVNDGLMMMTAPRSDQMMEHGTSSTSAIPPQRRLAQQQQQERGGGNFGAHGQVIPINNNNLSKQLEPPTDQSPEAAPSNFNHPAAAAPQTDGYPYIHRSQAKY